MMKYVFMILGLFPLLFGAVSLTMAAGGGGGSTPPPIACKEDVWECGDWSACSAQGSQTRTCDLKSNCPSVETPKPSSNQSCTPPTPVPTPTPAPTTPAKPATPAPAPTNPIKPSTPAAPSSLPPGCIPEWVCTDWSQCQENGNQKRTCSPDPSCAAPTTSKPEESQVCPGLQCGQLATLEDRAECRLGLTDEELKKEYGVLYFPEYCKVEETHEEKMACIVAYQSFLPCWEAPAGPKRGQCALRVLELTDVKAEKNACLAKGDNECLSKLEEKVEHLALFHMYELSFQAEELMKNGRADKADVTALVVKVEELKAELGKAQPTEWKAILTKAKAVWTEFKTKVTPVTE